MCVLRWMGGAVWRWEARWAEVGRGLKCYCEGPCRVRVRACVCGGGAALQIASARQRGLTLAQQQLACHLGLVESGQIYAAKGALPNAALYGQVLPLHLPQGSGVDVCVRVCGGVG